MAITLAQITKVTQDPLQKAILLNIIRDAGLFDTFPFETVDALKQLALRWTKLPTVASRQFNGGYTSNEQGDYEQVWEAVYAFGGDIVFDRVIDKLGHMIVDPVADQCKMKIKALAYGWKNYFINGDHAVDADMFEGLKKRVSLMPARQTVWFAASNAAGSNATNTAVLARSFFNKLDAMIKYCNDSNCNGLFLNEALLLGVTRAARLLQAQGAGIFDTTKDSLDRQVLTYRGSPLYDMGYKADQSTEIITVTEVGGDASANTTSIYGASFNTEQGIIGTQLDTPTIYDPLAGGEQESAPAKMRRIDWWNGLAGFGSFGIVRGRNILDPASWTE